MAAACDPNKTMNSTYSTIIADKREISYPVNLAVLNIREIYSMWSSDSKIIICIS